MISSEIKTKTTAISWNGRPINQYSFINGMAAMHRQEEKKKFYFAIATTAQYTIIHWFLQLKHLWHSTTKETDKQIQRIWS